MIISADWLKNIASGVSLVNKITWGQGGGGVPDYNPDTFVLNIFIAGHGTIH